MEKDQIIINLVAIIIILFVMYMIFAITFAPWGYVAIPDCHSNTTSCVRGALI